MDSSHKDIRIATLKATAEARKKETLERAEKAIRALVFRNERATFPNIAKEAGVSISYLYKYPDLKQRIQQLRSQQELQQKNKVRVPAPSDKSKETVIKHLRQRIQELESERNEQKKHITVLTGQLYEQSGERERVEHLLKENKRLNKRVKVLEAATSVDNVVAITPKKDIPQQIRAALSHLEIRLSVSLRERILNYPEQRVLDAIAVVQEALRAGEVRSKSGLLVKALEEAWEPSEDRSALEQERENREFSQWFDLARKKGLVQASRRTKKGIIVRTAKGKWVPYQILKGKQVWTMLER